MPSAISEISCDTVNALNSYKNYYIIIHILIKILYINYNII